MIGIIMASLLMLSDVYVEPRDTTPHDELMWENVGLKPTVGWASKDIHFRQFEAPGVELLSDTVIKAWRGERVGLEALVVTAVDLDSVGVSLSPWRDVNGKKYNWQGCSASLMRYVFTNSFRDCGRMPDLPAYTVADMIDLPGVKTLVEAKSVRPLWVTVETPTDAAPGKYTAELMVYAGKKLLTSLPVTIDLSERRLPAPQDMDFFLDLWQQPYSVSRFYGLKAWSKEHLEALHPYMELYSRAGQNTATAILFYEPWGEQSNDKFEPMVKTVLKPDGTWSFDYSAFDAYISLCEEYRMADYIECFSMVPWQMKFRYFDEAKGEYGWVESRPGEEAYSVLWTDFLKAFAAHLKEKGWFEKTLIAMDERGMADMLAAKDVLEKAVPGMGMSLAGNYHAPLGEYLQLCTLDNGDAFPPEVLKRRKAEGKKSLFYVCCSTREPNMFSDSSPADNAWLPLYARAAGFDGMLHWSFLNWTDNPLEDTRFFLFSPGDTFFAYPGPRSSLRYERMLEGIQLSEKLLILKKEAERKKDFRMYKELTEAERDIASKNSKVHGGTAEAVRLIHKLVSRF